MSFLVSLFGRSLVTGSTQIEAPGFTPCCESVVSYQWQTPARFLRYRLPQYRHRKQKEKLVPKALLLQNILLYEVFVLVACSSPSCGRSSEQATNAVLSPSVPCFEPCGQALPWVPPNNLREV